MCEIFIRASEQSYAPETRSLRLHGVATSLRLEQLFWQVLEEIAGRDGMRVTQLIERLYDELIEYRGQAANPSCACAACATSCCRPRVAFRWTRRCRSARSTPGRAGGPARHAL